MIGTTLGGRYEVIEAIGQGGFAVVYRARQISIDRDVAIKVLTLDASQDETIGRRFEAEAKIISQLRHPNTLKLIDFGQTEENRIYLVMELLNGSPLDDMVAQGALPPRQVVSILKQAAAALEEAHDLGVVHRDIKPANVFIEQVGRRQVVKVLDFGIAKVHSEQSHTMTGQMFGTPLYMSPEQVKGTPVDHRSDLYSLGVLAYQCLTGSVPFDGTTPYSICMKHANEAPPPMLSIDPGMIHSEVEDLVLRLLAKDPEDRPDSAGALIDELDVLDSLLKSKGEPDARTTSGFMDPNEVKTEVTRTPVPPRPQSQRSDAYEKTTIHSGGQTVLSHSSELSAPAEPKSSKGRLMAIGIAVAIGAGVGIAMMSQSGKDSKEAPSPAQTLVVATSSTGTNTPAPATPRVDAAPPAAKEAPLRPKPMAQAAVKPTAKKKKRVVKTRPAKARRKRKPTPAAERPKPQKPTVTPTRSGVASVRITLSPRKAVYTLTDRPKLAALALDASGRKVSGAVKWSVVPASAARIRKNQLRFSKEGRGKVKACVGAVCTTKKFMSLDDTGLP